MTGNQYLFLVLKKYEPSAGTVYLVRRAANQIIPILRVWSGNYFLGVNLSGSYAKGTAIKGGTDLDLFVSLRSITPNTLHEIYQNLLRFLKQTGYTPRPQNVSIHINHQGLSVDIIPGKRQSALSLSHSIYKNRTKTWIQTNIKRHIELIKYSKRRREIKLLKIWRQLYNLEFPSFYLELTVLKALLRRPYFSLEKNIGLIFKYLAVDFENARVVDPANTSNIISDDLTAAEKKKISNTAKECLEKPCWDQIIW